MKYIGGCIQLNEPIFYPPSCSRFLWLVCTLQLHELAGKMSDNHMGYIFQLAGRGAG